jgi:hypothetical protein
MKEMLGRDPSQTTSLEYADLILVDAGRGQWRVKNHSGEIYVMKCDSMCV